MAVHQAIGAGGDTAGSREALREIASAPFGRIMLGLLAVGLACYVIWRLVQALLDPEADWTDDDEKRWAKRAFYLVSAALYAMLTYYAATLVLDPGGGGGGSMASGGAGAGGGSGGSGGGGGTSGLMASLMSESWGVWAVGAIGAAVMIRGLLQFWKAYTESFKERITSFDLGPARRDWVLRASRLGLTARGVVFVLIGGSIGWAAVTHDASDARGLEGALEFLTGTPWLLGAVGAGLVGYAVYQWVKARYRLIGV